MKRIVCYGDSNTWGTIPGMGPTKRLEEEKQYTKILQKILGKDWDVITEGLISRTVGTDDIKEPIGNRNGAVYFPQCIRTHDPVDYVVIFLGTNDLKEKFNKTAKDCALALQEKYIKVLRGSLSKELLTTPQIIIVAPPEVKDGLFDEFNNAELKSKDFNKEYQKVALKNKCFFIGNDKLLAGKDGVHMVAESHIYLAKEIAKVIKSL